MPWHSLSCEMDSVFPHVTERSKTTFQFWPITDMSSSDGALWRSCLTVTVLCHSTWMTWRRRTSASSSASTSWKRGYSRSTRRAVRMSTVRWVHRLSLSLRKWMEAWLWCGELLFGGQGSFRWQKVIRNHWFCFVKDLALSRSFVPLSAIIDACYHASMQPRYPGELSYWASSTICWPSCDGTWLTVCFTKYLFLDMAALWRTAH